MPTGRERSEANLILWKKGQSGNPGGRPQRTPVTDAYLWLWGRKVPAKLRKKWELPAGATWGQAVAMGQFIGAAEGRSANASEIGDRLEGKPNQRIELSGSDDKPPIQISAPNLANLSKEELVAYRELLSKTRRSES